MPKTKEQKREEAMARDAENAKLSTKEKLAKLEGRGITKGREYDRLVEQLATKL